MKVIIDVKYDEYTGEYFIELPQEILDAANLYIGDTIIWENNNDDSWTVRKKSG